MIRILLFLCLTFDLFGQGYQDYVVNDGPPGIMDSNEVYLPIGTEIEIQFSTISIPDTLIIECNDRRYSFYVGAMGFYQPGTSLFGYNEFSIDDDIDTLSINSFWINPKFTLTNSSFPDGKLLLKIKLTDCHFKWKCVGNAVFWTLYEMTIETVKLGDWQKRIEYVITCEPYATQTRIEDCEFIYTKYIDSSIVDLPIVINSECETSQDGTIVFLNHPEWNLYHLNSGIHTFTVSNAYCNMQFEVKVNSNHYCNLYIPNIFEPNSITNSKFKLFGTIENNDSFEIFIFDRWGNLILNQYSDINSFEWDGGNYQAGVYTYEIIFTDGKIAAGDITLLR